MSLFHSIFTSLFYFVIVIGVMVLVHEFGHFAVAKLLGVRVEQFAIGFGTRLFGFRKGGTDYRVNALPFGGYVRMAGENPMDERSGDPGEFLSHPRWQRFLIAIAGPVMNILLAIGLLTGVYMVHYEHPAYLDQQAVVGWVEHGSPADIQGIQPGDRIVQIDGVQDPTWEQVEVKQLLSTNQPLGFAVERGGHEIQGSIVPVATGTSEAGSAGWFPVEPVIIGDLESGMPAAQAGLKAGDKIVSIDGQTVPSIQAMIERLQQTKGKPVDLVVEREGKQLSFSLAPVLADTPGAAERHYRLGFKNSYETAVAKLSFADALRHSIQDNKRYSAVLLELVGKLVRHKASLNTVSGPIGIAEQTGEAAQEKGWIPLLALSAAISLNLGIFNLLPIPIMDGGVILLLFIEGLMRRDISLQIKERIYQAAFVFLVLFAALVVYNDIAKTIAQRLP
jgi:regulator of sigma E protease